MPFVQIGMIDTAGAQRLPILVTVQGKVIVMLQALNGHAFLLQCFHHLHFPLHVSLELILEADDVLQVGGLDAEMFTALQIGRQGTAADMFGRRFLFLYFIHMIIFVLRKPDFCTRANNYFYESL